MARFKWLLTKGANMLIENFTHAMKKVLERSEAITTIENLMFGLNDYGEYYTVLDAGGWHIWHRQLQIFTAQEIGDLIPKLEQLLEEHKQQESQEKIK